MTRTDGSLEPTSNPNQQHTTHRQDTTVNDLIQIQPVDETLISTKPVARCADGNGTLTPLFFSDHVLDIARAKAICGRCALREQCLREALDREEPWGVWGGELLTMGRIVAHKRPGGRPPKRPRPPIVVDELGIVELVTFDDFDDVEDVTSETEPVAV
jgi:hypothetical protein